MASPEKEDKKYENMDYSHLALKMEKSCDYTNTVKKNLPSYCIFFFMFGVLSNQFYHLHVQGK